MPVRNARKDDAVLAIGLPLPRTRVCGGATQAQTSRSMRAIAPERPRPPRRAQAAPPRQALSAPRVAAAAAAAALLLSGSDPALASSSFYEKQAAEKAAIAQSQEKMEALFAAQLKANASRAQLSSE